MTTPSFAEKWKLQYNQSLNEGKSAGVDNIPAELVQAGGEDVVTALTTICNRIWQTREWPTPWTQSLVISRYTFYRTNFDFQTLFNMLIS